MHLVTIGICGKYGYELMMADFLSREQGVASGGMRAGMVAFRLIRKMQRIVFRGVAGDFDPVARD